MEPPALYRLLATFFAAISFCVQMAFVENKARHHRLMLGHHGYESSKSKMYYDVAEEVADKSESILDSAPIILMALFLLNCGIFPYLWRWAGKPIRALKSRLIVEIIQSSIFVSMLVIALSVIALPFQIPRIMLVGGGIYAPLTEIVVRFISLPFWCVACFFIGLILSSIFVPLWHFSPYCLSFSLLLFKLAWNVGVELRRYALAVNWHGLLQPLSLDNKLGIQISQLANKLGFPVDRIFLDTKFSSDVEFVGGMLPFRKILLIGSGVFEKYGEKVTMALVARELGHWYMSHKFKAMIIEFLFDLCRALLFCFLAFRPALYSAFGFEPRDQQQVSNEIELETGTGSNGKPKKSWYNPKLMPLCIALLLFWCLELPLRDISDYTLNAVNIHQQYSVDKFAVEQGYKEGLVKDIKSHMDNVHEGEDVYFEYCTMKYPNPFNRLEAINAK